HPVGGLAAAVAHTDQLEASNLLQPRNVPHAGVVARPDQANFNGLYTHTMPFPCNGLCCVPLRADYSVLPQLLSMRSSHGPCALVGTALVWRVWQRTARFDACQLFARMDDVMSQHWQDGKAAPLPFPLPHPSW